MNNSATLAVKPADNVWSDPKFKRRLKRRHLAEVRFKFYCLAAVLAGIFFVGLLFVSIAINGIGAFTQTQIQLNVYFDPEVVNVDNIQQANYGKIVKQSLYSYFPEVTKRKDRRKLGAIVSVGADVRLQRMVENDPSLIGTKQTIWMPVDDEFDMLHKKKFGRENVGRSGSRGINSSQAAWFDALVERGIVETRFNRTYLTAGDSREPELAGVRGALTGSFYTILVTLLISFPVGAAAACYLEEFAPKNRFTDFVGKSTLTT